MSGTDLPTSSGMESSDHTPEAIAAELLAPATLMDLEHMSLGYSPSEAGELRNTAPGTISNLRTDIVKAMEAHNPPHAVRKGFKRGFLHPREKPPVIRAELSVLERSLLKLISFGYTTKEIADELDVPLGAAKKGRDRVLDKLRARTSGQAVRIGVELNILDLTDEEGQKPAIGRLGSMATADALRLEV